MNDSKARAYVATLNHDGLRAIAEAANRVRFAQWVDMESGDFFREAAISCLCDVKQNLEVGALLSKEQREYVKFYMEAEKTMQTYRYTNTPTAADLNAAAKLKLIPPGVKAYADPEDYRAKGGGDNPAPAPAQYGEPKHWAYSGAKYNFGRPGLWFVFLDILESVNALAPGSKIDGRPRGMGLTNRETWGVLSQPNFYSTNAEYIPVLPRFRYAYVTNEELARLSIGASPRDNKTPFPVAFLFEDETGPIDWLDPYGNTAFPNAAPTGFKFRSSFPSNVGLRGVSGGGVEAFLISEWTPPATGSGKTYRAYSDAEQLEFVTFALDAPGNAASAAAKIRAFFER